MQKDFESKQKMIEFIEKNGGKERWLLKTFFEGGYGDVYTGDKLIQSITQFSTEKLDQFLLVYRIDSPTYSTIIFKDH